LLGVQHYGWSHVLWIESGALWQRNCRSLQSSVLQNSGMHSVAVPIEWDQPKQQLLDWNLY
jgi:hypothetical protein